jgi:hypothetical protein
MGSVAGRKSIKLNTPGWPDMVSVRYLSFNARFCAYIMSALGLSTECETDLYCGAGSHGHRHTRTVRQPHRYGIVGFRASEQVANLERELDLHGVDL